jgi:hypothetical protein
VYNMRGIQNSNNLCRVFTSNEAVLQDPLTEVQRISNELTSKCNVPAPPKPLTIEEVNKFVDTTLQHNTKKIGEDLPIIEVHGADCNVHDLVTTTSKDDARYAVEKKLYRIAMKLFCDMNSGVAYQENYEWPAL